LKRLAIIVAIIRKYAQLLYVALTVNQSSSSSGGGGVGVDGGGGWSVLGWVWHGKFELGAVSVRAKAWHEIWRYLKQLAPPQLIIYQFSPHQP
jgi:hypothetical protein